MRLFIKTISVLGGVIGMFCLNSFAQLGLNIVWIALLGAVTLLIITDVKDMSAVLAKVISQKFTLHHTHPPCERNHVDLCCVALCRWSLAHCCSSPRCL